MSFGSSVSGNQINSLGKYPWEYLKVMMIFSSDEPAKWSLSLESAYVIKEFL
ncbi:hypothetical protein [Xenorhabdus sp. TS4]|uniref:hypothetical protein n=1 Tax=Xenorhabdus sp. TS4 TaxID=1873483 RepID=UPI001656EA50|nr:hypothetical protein [Xenorhabdus sp. TS4]